MQSLKKNDSGVFPVLIAIALIILAVALIGLYFWPFYTLGILAMIFAIFLMFQFGNPKVAAIFGIIGGALIAYGYFWG